MLALALGWLVAVAQPGLLPPDGCTADRDMTVCTATAARTETVERTMVAACLDATTGLPGRRARTLLDTYAVTETTTVRRAGDGRIVDAGTVEVSRDLVGSQLLSDTCTPGP